MTLEHCIKQFLDHQLANGRSPHTIGAQQRDLNLLLDRLGNNCDIQAITSSDIDGFLLSEPVQKQSNGQPKQTSSINRTRASLKGFFRWLTDTSQIDHNPTAGVHIKQKSRKPPIFLTENEKRMLLKTIRSQKGWQANRDLVIVQLFLNTGIRLSELVNLNISDVNLLEKRIIIQAKGGQTVNRFLNTKLRTILHRYMKERKKMSFDCLALFLSQRLERITARQVQRRLGEWVAKAGMSKNIHPHSLRHSFACNLYNRSLNILAVQQALGHRSIQSSMIYTHLFDDALESALETL